MFLEATLLLHTMVTETLGQTSNKVSFAMVMLEDGGVVEDEVTLPEDGAAVEDVLLLVI